MSRPDGRRRRRKRDLAPAADQLARWQRKATGKSGAPGPELSAARAGWARAGGPALAAQSIPLRRSRAGVLTVACASAAWAQALQARAEELLVRLAEAAPEARVTSLRFVVSDDALPEPPPPPKAPPRPPSAAVREAAREAVGEVSDPRLRELLERAAAAALNRDDRN
ncbi:MAG: Dna[CI] antecedent, DciA [Miltoncostaeaceae bacterium]|nr:Dna[CI] antecedent, DciA [Miltoncostaeaceae bacterium]